MGVSYTKQAGPCRRISDKSFDSNLQNLLAAVYSVDDCKIACTADETCVAFGWSDVEGCRQYYPDPTSDYSGDDQISGYKCYIKNSGGSPTGGNDFCPWDDVKENPRAPGYPGNTYWSKIIYEKIIDAPGTLSETTGDVIFNASWGQLSKEYMTKEDADGVCLKPCQRYGEKNEKEVSRMCDCANGKAINWCGDNLPSVNEPTCHSYDFLYGCVSGEDIKLVHGVATLEECQALCSDYGPECLAVEYFVVMADG